MATDTAAQPPAGMWVPTELAERVQETMGEFLWQPDEARAKQEHKS